MGEVIAGVIEGFYGPPWSHDERLDLIAFCGAEGFSTWVHAPKDDPFHRERWRDPYPSEELERLGELAAAAAGADVEFSYAIAPGLSLRYDDESDFDALLAKCEQARSVGVERFQLLWDDLEETEGSAAGHALVSNRFAESVEQPGPLVVCPLDYAGCGDSPYRRALREQLDPAILVYWTGAEVVSQAIERAELDQAADALGHELVLWDNYPVNDFAPHKLFLGPLRRRDPALFDGRCAGLVANAMQQAVPSKLPLATIAEFLRDPHGYDPELAFERALRRYGAEVAAALEAREADRP